MDINEVTKKNLLKYNAREFEITDDDLLNSKVGDLTVMQLVAILRMVKSNTRITRSQKYLDADKLILEYIKKNPNQTARQISNGLKIGFSVTKYYLTKLRANKQVVGYGMRLGSNLFGYYIYKEDNNGNDISRY